MEELRKRLHSHSNEYSEMFTSFQKQLVPILDTVNQLFPNFTRHDSTHTVKLEEIVHDIARTEVLDAMTPSDLLVLLCSLWLHDAGMANLSALRERHSSGSEFKALLLSYQRRGLDEDDAWRDFARERHHLFCEDVMNLCLDHRLPKEMSYWVSAVSRSHGEAEIHNREKWPDKFAVAGGQHIHPPVLACLLRISDILHFNSQRAPEYLIEHRKIVNAVSINHWRAHQVCADYTHNNDICYIDGVTEDDEAYWFAQQFIKAMDDEVKYCQQFVMPNLIDPFKHILIFSRVENRIRPHGFDVSRPITLKVETERFLEDLLNDALYANKPTWFRELMQNCFDACRDFCALRTNAKPRVVVRFDSKQGIIEFEDYGIGMKPTTVIDYMLVAGASYWNSEDYKGSRDAPSGHVGKFGIGFMSVFGIATQVKVTTRYAESTKTWAYEIRHPKAVVKMSRSDRTEPGTTVSIKIKPEAQFKFDVVNLFEEYCPFPEFPVTLEVDGEIAVAITECKAPSAETSGFQMAEYGQCRTKGKLLQINIGEKGIVGDLHIAKIKLNCISAYVPVHPQYLQGAGWDFNRQSAIYYGGIKYPNLHVLDGTIGFTHIPSIGTLRVAVSPNDYPLEMNLSREQFISGTGTAALFRDLCHALDKIMAADMRLECDGKDASCKSAIAGIYSDAMMNLWLGQVHHLTYVRASDHIIAQPVAGSPWPESTKFLKDTLLFTLADLSGKTHKMTLGEMIDTSTVIFAIGVLQQGISPHILDEISAFDSSAKLLLVLPHPKFGLKELQHWAQEELLVPVLAHQRCTVGLRLGCAGHPFAFFPREADRFGLPVASGPSQFAALDYRDHMLEVGMSLSGGPDIIAVLNRRNAKVVLLLNMLERYATKQDLFRVASKEVTALRKAMIVGHKNKYNSGSAKRLAVTLNRLYEKVCRDQGHEAISSGFLPDDMPPYFDNGQVVPFGSFLLENVAANALKEKDTYGRIGSNIIMA